MLEEFRPDSGDGVDGCGEVFVDKELSTLMKRVEDGDAALAP